MLAVARANLDYICCICFVDVRPLMSTQKVYDIKKENNIHKILKLTAYITILKNPLNQKYINDYCRKICETCFVKIEYSYTFRERIIASTVTLNELLDSSELSEQDIERLSYFCRICLNRQKTTKNTKFLKMLHLNWIKDCSGIRFTSLVDIESFRIKEGTNINEIAVINDTHFPQQLCLNCFKKLQNVEEFRRSTTQSFEYMISVIDGEIGPEDYLVTQEVKQIKENIFRTEGAHPEPGFLKFDILEIDNVQENYNTEMHETCDDLKQMINSTDYSKMEKIEDVACENAIDCMGDIPQYSDSSDQEFTLNLNNVFADYNDINKKTRLKKKRPKKSKQCNINERHLWSREENIETENAIKYNIKMVEERNPKEVKENDDFAQADTNSDTNKADEECSQIYSSRYQRTVNNFDSKIVLYECLICSKEFKRESHLTDHIKAVHEKLRPFKCSHCPKTFSAKNSKRVHELQHTGDYPFVCNCCGKMFRRSSQLKVHLEIHTTSPELLCPICKRCQKNQNDLEDHLKSHNDKRLQCPLCGKFFTRSSHLKDHHNAVHLKLRPFKCELCESAFGDRKTRRNHEKTHTKDRPIKCSDCKSSFNNNSALTNHIHQFCHKAENNESRHKGKKKSK